MSSRLIQFGLCILCIGGVGVGSRLLADYNQDTNATVGNLTSRTFKAAPDGTTPDTRLTIGLGEQVQVNLDSASWSDTDENKTTGAIESDTIGNRVWTCGGKGSVSPGGVTTTDMVTMTASFDPGTANLVVLVYDSGTKYNDTVLTRTMDFSVIKPDGEVTRFDSWEDGTGPNAIFTGVLTPKSVCFGNINVKEGTGAGSKDECWYVGSPDADPWEQVPPPNFTGSNNWDIDDQNHWQYDYMGWGTTLVDFYRVNPTPPRAPCKTTIKQTMLVIQGSSGQYEEHDFVAEIGATTVTVTRDSESATRTYP